MVIISISFFVFNIEKIVNLKTSRLIIHGGISLKNFHS